jgi:hypothetical protein
MKNPGRLSVIILSVMALLTLGCATYTTTYDYDPSVRFAELRNFNWLNPPSGGQAMDELTVKRIKASVERQLAEKGYTMDTSNPDFLITAHGGKEKKVDVVDWGYTYRGSNHYNYGFDGRNRPIDVYEYQEGTLILDFVDAASRELIWRGSVSKVIDPSASPEKRDKTINEAVAKVLEKFPPPAK